MPRVKKETVVPAAVVPAPVVVPAPLPVVTESVAVESGPDTAVSKKVRKVVSLESYQSSFDDVLKKIDEEIESNKDSDDKQKVKFLKYLSKQLKVLKTDSNKIAKQKKVKRQTNGQSGFMKPVKISKQMADFTGWPQDNLHSRVDVTKFICQYIKDNNLQNPADRRNILSDAKLNKLLNYNPKVDPVLNYPKIQKLLQSHYIKTE